MSVEVTRLPSGLVVITDAMAHLETTSLGVWVGAGSRDELAALDPRASDEAGGLGRRRRGTAEPREGAHHLGDHRSMLDRARRRDHHVGCPIVARKIPCKAPAIE